jgi:peptide/nickel transport system substrate-binding protein
MIKRFTASRSLLAGAAAAALALAAPMAHAELQKQHVGGTTRLSTRSAEGTLDPQINYTLKNWQLYQFLYDGLVAFQKAEGAAGFKIVPDLAESIPAAQDGGKTYVFKLRKGIHFSNGKEVTVDDVVASFRRIFKVSCPTAGTFYNSIVGADDCLKTPATCTLPGVVGDAATNTVTFHLTQPDAEFFDQLGVPHASILPADTPTKDLGTTAAPGTGAYMITAFDPNKAMAIERNPHFKVWSEAAQPDGYPDKIVYTYGLTDEANVTAIENNQSDWMFDPPPPDRLAEIGTKYAKQVHINPLTAMWYVPFNVNTEPFNNLDARLAVNYAIDRSAIIKIFGGPALGTPSCQILPPGFAGYEPYCPYTKNPGAKWSAPDMAKAMEHMKKSGKTGAPVTIITEETDVSKGIGTYLQSVLNKLGFKASIKPLSSDIEFTYIQNTKNNVQMSVTQWYQDYPAPSDFLNVLFSCASFHPGSDSSVNIAGFCDKKIDADMQKALATSIADPKGAAMMWAAIDKEVTDASPAAVLFTPKHVDFVSKNVGNFIFNAQYYWVIPLSWVK